MTSRTALAGAAMLGALVLAGCAGTGTGTGAHTRADTPASRAPAADSATVALWHLDETGGLNIADAGPYRLQGVAGIDTRTDFGRYHLAREFQSLVDSYLYVPYNPVMDVTGPFTVEAWIRADNQTVQFAVIAARWTPTPNQQSWVLGITGPLGSPNAFNVVTNGQMSQRLVFGYVPAGAGSERGYASNNPVPLGRWVHVAASVDGEIVKIFLDGRLDGQYVNTSTIRPSTAPLVIGNAIDTRHLTTFGGDLRLESSNPGDESPFIGFIDEVRISRGARTQFEGTGR